jgi:hypothetical protein
MQLQVLEARYVDLQRLVNLLNTAFGAGNFEVKTEVRSFPNMGPSRGRE